MDNLGVTSATLILMTEEETGALVAATDRVAAAVEDRRLGTGGRPVTQAGRFG